MRQRSVELAHGRRSLCYTGAMKGREYTPMTGMFRPEELLKSRQLDPARLSARQAIEAIRDIAAETVTYASHEYYAQRIMVIEMLAERALGEEG